MAINAVQLGSNLITFSDQGISRALLVVGAGILTYDTVSKIVNKIAGDTLSNKWVAPVGHQWCLCSQPLQLICRICRCILLLFVSFTF